MASLLTINTNVPTRDDPGTPVVVFYDNGDWEIAFAGDVDYISTNAETFVGSELAIDVLISLNAEIDGDDIDETEDGAWLFTSETIVEGSIEEPVLVLYDDGETDVYDRMTAENLVGVDDSGVFNFIPVIELLEELRNFVGRNHADMFDWRETDLVMGDPDEPEESE